jgi:hypothetical protein
LIAHWPHTSLAQNVMEVSTLGYDLKRFVMR